MSTALTRILPVKNTASTSTILFHFQASSPVKSCVEGRPGGLPPIQQIYGWHQNLEASDGEEVAKAAPKKARQRT